MGQAIAVFMTVFGLIMVGYAAYMIRYKKAHSAAAFVMLLGILVVVRSMQILI